MKVIVPPIKSQGIKTKLVPWILAQIPDRKGRWIEPFMGTGVVGFNARFPVSTMSDVNPHLVAFYRGIQEGSITPESVNAYLTREGQLLSRAGDNGYDHYRLVRARFNQSSKPDPLDFLFLNRAGFNGMIRFSKNGWNIPFCKKPDRFIGALKTKIVNQVRNVGGVISPDWVFKTSGFHEIIESAKSNDVIYCDPPYQGRSTDYFSKWDERLEDELVALLKKTRARFIFSTWHHNEYRVNELIKKHWSGYNVLTQEHFYHAGANEKNRKPMVEAIITNFQPLGMDISTVVEVDEGDL